MTLNQAYWVDNIEMRYNPITGKKDYPLKMGYICSNCYKHEWSAKPVCTGCNCSMTISSNPDMIKKVKNDFQKYVEEVIKSYK